MTTTAEKPRTEIPPFKNEVVKDFKDPADIAAMEAALAGLAQGLGKHYPLIIGGRRGGERKSHPPRRSPGGRRQCQFGIEGRGDGSHRGGDKGLRILEAPVAAPTRRVSLFGRGALAPTPVRLRRASGLRSGEELGRSRRRHRRVDRLFGV